jgi:hypothetical protein
MKRRNKFAFTLITTSVLILIVLVLYVNIKNVPFPIFNPPDENTTWLADISFGQPPGISAPYPNGAEILINVNATGTLVSGEPARMIAHASTTPALKQNLSSMVISIEGAVQYLPISPSSYYGEVDFNSSGVQLQYETPCLSPVSFGSDLCGSPNQIEWTAEGSYYPMVTFIFKNMSGPRTFSFPDYRITVSSAQVLSADRYNRINELLTIVLVGFAFLEGIKILLDFMREDTRSAALKIN